jgi:hypothetical protein
MYLEEFWTSTTSARHQKHVDVKLFKFHVCSKHPADASALVKHPDVGT